MHVMDRTVSVICLHSFVRTMLIHHSKQQNCMSPATSFSHAHKLIKQVIELNFSDYKRKRKQVMGNILMSLITDAAEERAKKRALEKKRQTIRELIYTEENYLTDVLGNLVNFKVTLSSTLEPEKLNVLFANVEDLVALTRSVLGELKSAIENAEQVNIGLAFVQHKFDFTIYAIFCTKLPKAKLLYDNIMTGDDINLLNEMIRVEQLANVESSRQHPSTYKPYTLKALLQDPAIRCYRYADILKGIGKYCDDKSSAEYESLFQAAEVMTDISQLCNICLRDRENLDVIAIVEHNLLNAQLTLGSSLSQYGRLRRYGKLTLEYPQDGERYERSCLVFDKVMILTRKVQQQYIFERSLILEKYSLGTTAISDPKMGGAKTIVSKALQQTLNKYKTMFYLDAVCSNVAPYSVKFYCADERRKAEWISAITSAKKNTQPLGYRLGKFRFYMHTFSRAEDCDYCGRLMKGLFWQGYVCAATHRIAHRQCIPGLVALIATSKKYESGDGVCREIEDPIVKDIQVPYVINKTLLSGYSARLTREDKMKKTALFEKVKHADEKRGAMLPEDRPAGPEVEPPVEQAEPQLVTSVIGKRKKANPTNEDCPPVKVEERPASLSWKSPKLILRPPGEIPVAKVGAAAWPELDITRDYTYNTAETHNPTQSMGGQNLEENTGMLTA